MSRIRISIQIFTQSDLFVPGRPIRGASIRTMPQSECVSAPNARAQEPAASHASHIELKPVEPICFLAGISDQSWLWHGRLGHVNFRALKMLVEKDTAGGTSD